jgi:hypothetical protein
MSQEPSGAKADGIHRRYSSRAGQGAVKIALAAIGVARKLNNR